MAGDFAFSARWQSTHQPIVSGGWGGRSPTRFSRSLPSRGPVRAPNVVIVSTGPGDNGTVAFRIRDTGPGMTQKEIATALEPLQELAISIKHGAGGNGLDLPLTKALAEANHASLHIESRPDCGTLVEVAFPTARAVA